MQNDLVNMLKPSEDIDWDDHPGKSFLLGVWTLTKWVTIGTVVAAALILYWCMTVVFAAVGGRRDEV